MYLSINNFFRLGQLNTSHKNIVINRSKDWDQIEYEWEKAEREEMLKQLNEKQIKKTNNKTISGSCTVIHLGEDGVTTRIEERIKDIPVSTELCNYIFSVSGMILYSLRMSAFRENY